MEQDDQILDYEYEEPKKANPELYLAGTGQRLANYLLDRIGVYLLMMIITAVFGGAGEAIGLDAVADIGAVAMLLAIPGYYVVCEYVFGKTPAKFITKTHVVTEDGGKPSLGTIIGRSLCRLIPFEQFSFLGIKAVGWHDSISKTRVVVDSYRCGSASDHTNAVGSK